MLNETLADRMSVPQQNRERINALHEYLETIIAMEILHGYNEEVFKEIEEIEFELQSLWGFPNNPNMHTWKNRYKFKADWIGRKFIDLDTNTEFTIPVSVYKGAYYNIGNNGSAIDVGDGHYYRIIGNIREVLDE